MEGRKATEGTREKQPRNEFPVTVLSRRPLSPSTAGFVCMVC